MVHIIDDNTKNTIVNLRKEGLSYSEINKKLNSGIAKSTLSKICKGVNLPDLYYTKQRKNLLKRLELNRQHAIQTNKMKLTDRMKIIQNNAIEVINSKTLINEKKVNLSILYLAEGSKYNSYRGLALGSSDPTVIKLFMSLLFDCYGKKICDFKARIQYRCDQDIRILQTFWSKELNIEMNNFYKTTPDKRSLGKITKNQSYKGVCVVSCKGTDIQLELDAIARLYSNKIWGISSVG